MFRMSLSWTRLLPNGFINHVSKSGVRFYNNVLDEILANGMIPMVVIFHWDLPYSMQQMGGLTNPRFVDWFEQYARFAFNTFGDKVGIYDSVYKIVRHILLEKINIVVNVMVNVAQVKFWVTINEPNIICGDGYGDATIIPAVNVSGIADYNCGHHALLAHARAYRLYDREFRSRQNGKSIKRNTRR